MPELNWEVFAALPGAATRNWEVLCRELVRRNYERYGRFAFVAMQPGVEFHLRIEREGPLGEPGRHWGWQCRWFELRGGRPLGTTRRRKIKEALATTKEHLPELTDWVLWLRRPLSPADAEWFWALETKMEKHLWTAEEVENHLIGDAAVLRSVYFGEQVLTPEGLASIHERSIAPVKGRYDPAVHVEVGPEAMLRSILGEPEAWPELPELAERLRRRVEILDGPSTKLDEAERKLVAALSADLSTRAEQFGGIAKATAEGRPDVARALSEQEIETSSNWRALQRLIAQMRSRSSPISLSLTAALDDLRRSAALHDAVRSSLSVDLCAVIADAGQGKTYMGAELTSATDRRPCGMFLLARPLRKAGTLDGLARRVPGGAFSTFDELLEAVDAAGARAGARLPVVIDGLNESEDPRDWRDLLATVRPSLPAVPHVLIVVTLRGSVAKDALPADTRTLALEGFAHEVDEAVVRYFRHYKIDPGDALLPYGRFRQPLFLRLFCEATNPDRQKVVGVEKIPTSLTAVFGRYRDVAVERVARALRISESDVRVALDAVALELWELNARTLPFDELRRLVGDGPRDWDHSLARALEEEGVLSRDPGEERGDQRSAVLFDAFAGHLIADALIRRTGGSAFQAWLSEAGTQQRLSPPKGHPLQSDILRALIGLLPRTLNVQLWPMLAEPLRRYALLEASELEGELVDQETAVALVAVVRAPPPRRGDRDLFDRLRVTRSVDRHPLNAEFLDQVLRPMPLGDRDLRWTEWVRRRSEVLRQDVGRLKSRWSVPRHRSGPPDRLEARWLAWLLTSTVRPLRDEATEALVLFGRRDPKGLFELCLDLLDVNDPYVPERVTAAAYGAAMANQVPEDGFVEAFTDLLSGLALRLSGDAAAAATSHWLTREYVRGMFEFGTRLCPAVLPDGVEGDGAPRFFGFRADVAPIGDEHPCAGEANEILGMDFENYTIGGLVRDRSNYDMAHADLRRAVAYIRGRAWELGWRRASHGELDRTIARDHSHSRQRPAKVERYGKKYGWIGFYEWAGRLDDEDALPLERRDSFRLPDVDIDPSFPAEPPRLDLALPAWVRPTPRDDRRWIRQGIVKVPDDLLRPDTVDKQEGPWIAAHGFLSARDDELDRRVWGFVRTMLVESRDLDRLVSMLAQRPYLGNRFVADPPESYYLFAGEVPWSRAFAANGVLYEGLQPYEAQVDRGDRAITVELLAHTYAFEDYHSVTVRASNFEVPSHALSESAGLLRVPPSFDHVDSDRRAAAITCRAPEGFDGDLLYLREDLVRRYAGEDRRLVWLVWGEREILRQSYGGRTPAWLSRVARGNEDLWRRVAILGRAGCEDPPSSS